MYPSTLLRDFGNLFLAAIRRAHQHRLALGVPLGSGFFRASRALGGCHGGCGDTRRSRCPKSRIRFEPRPDA